jgi:hypothetical protein
MKIIIYYDWQYCRIPLVETAFLRVPRHYTIDPERHHMQIAVWISENHER